MARDLSQATKSESQKKSGAEALLVLKIEWSDGDRYYGDKDTTVGSLGVDGRILRVSPIQFSVAVDDVGSASVLTVTLSDNDLSLQTLMRTQLLENRIAKVYHHFEGLGESDLVMILNGVVTSPIRWDESSRQLTFSIEGTVNSQTVGYRPADGDFPNLHADGVGRTWPVCFGTPLDVPATLVNTANRGKLATDVTMNATEFDVLDGDLFTQGSPIVLRVGEELIQGTFSGSKEGVRTFSTLSRNQYAYVNQGFYQRPLPEIDIDTNDAHYVWIPVEDIGNRYVGLWFEIESTYVPSSSTPKQNYCISQEGQKLRFQYPWNSGSELGWEIGPTVFADCRAFNVSDQFRILKAGSPVTEWGSEAEVYVANELSSTSVLRVRAWKNVQYNAVGASYRAFVDVPSAYYVVNLADASLGAPDGRTPTTITFPVRLPERGDWESGVVYISLVSSIGDNTADVIEWILNNYTDLTPDATHFTSVQESVENYPNHFAIIEQKDALRLCGEIAWQARCGLFSVGSTAYLRYLSEEVDVGDAQITLDDAQDNILDQGLQVEFTDLADVFTVFNARWKRNLSEDWSILPYEENVDLLGHRESDFDFYIYQTESLVQKSASFWAGRYARVWRHVQVTAFLDALGLDILDSVLLSVSDLALPLAKTVVREVSHNTSEHLIKLYLWLPIEAGTVVQSTAAWVDDTGDSKPADPSVNISEVDFEVWSIPPLQFNFPVAIKEASKTLPAKIVADLGGGAYRAVTYPNGFGASPTDTIILNKVGDNEFEDDDECLATRPETEGAWYSAKGGEGGTAAIPGVILSGSGLGPYQVRLYANGPGEDPTGVGSCYPLQVDGSFGAGLWIFVYVLPDGKAWFQGPVWVDDG